MKYLLLLISLIVVFNVTLKAKNHIQYEQNINRLADAIYWAEGGSHAKVAYGILSVRVKDEGEARRVCKNTIRNNIERYRRYGFRTHRNYISWLAQRYAPVGSENDLSNLNRHWIKNVKYFYYNPKPIG